MTSATEIRKLLKSEKLVIGTDNTMKQLKKGKLQKILLASNCEEKTEKDIEYYAKMSETEVVKTDILNDELGTICKKPFSISVLGVLK
jgi:large subunit ribosomal protein L30e